MRIPLLVLLFVSSLGLGTAATAQESFEISSGPVCEAPISVCGTEGGPASTREGCPPGYRCTCVPSCPVCRDCRVFVCVSDPQEPECRTACDCEPGQGCFDGQCTAGFAPVYCCDEGACPPGGQCQARSGEMSRCSGSGGPSCRHRVLKSQKVIARLVERGARCREDADCVHVSTTTQCLGACGEVVNRRAARKIARAIERLDRKVCNGYREDGCPYATPGCLPVIPVCEENRCVGVAGFVMPPARSVVDPAGPSQAP